MTDQRPLNAPNLITLARMLTIPLIVWLLTLEDTGLRILAVVLFAIAAGTDWVDGWVARKYDMVSPLGRMLDPIADKLLVGLVLAALCWDGSFSALDLVPVMVILFREFFVSGLREFLGATKIVLPVTQLAKWKTTLQLFAMIIVMLEAVVPGLGFIGDVVLWIAAAITLWTGIEYFRASWPHLSGAKS